MLRSAALLTLMVGFSVAVSPAQPPEMMPGWPKDFRADYTFVNPAGGLPIIDLDRDGDLELVFPSLDTVYIYHHDGTRFANWPQASGNGYIVMKQLAVGDIDGDGEYDIVTQSDKPRTGRLCAWSLDGQLKPNFPIESGFVQQSPCLYDLDGDGGDEIIMPFDDSSVIYVWRGDGSYYPGWPKYGIRSAMEPAVGDIDGDNDPEIVLQDWDGYVYAWHDNGEIVEGYPIDLTDDHSCFTLPPSLYDFNGNDTLDILLTQLIYPFPYHETRVHVLNTRGEHYPGWPRDFPGHAHCTPTAGDFSSETPFLEVAFGTKIDGIYYLLDSEGFVMYGWPNHAPWNGNTWDSPVIGDIDGDEELEVVFDCSSGDVTDTGVVGYVWAFNPDGSSVENFPLRVVGTTFAFVPAIGDVDNDGILEMVVMSRYEVGFTRMYNRVAIYKLHTPYNPDLMIWPMSAHDPQRTNNATFKRPTWVDDFRSELKPERFELAQNYPNPFNSRTTIKYSVKASYPVQVRLKVFNISGQEVRDLVDKVERTGSYFITWDGCNSGGEEVASGIYIYRLTVGDGSSSERKMVFLR
jgi:hypothetical protein